MVDFACTDDLQYVVIVGVRDCNKNGQSNLCDHRDNNADDGGSVNRKTAKHSRSRGKANRQKSLARNDTDDKRYSTEVLFRDFNPNACKIFAMENGLKVFYSC